MSLGGAMSGPFGRSALCALTKSIPISSCLFNRQNDLSWFHCFRDSPPMYIVSSAPVVYIFNVSIHLNEMVVLCDGHPFLCLALSLCLPHRLICSHFLIEGQRVGFQVSNGSRECGFNNRGNPRHVSEGEGVVRASFAPTWVLRSRLEVLTVFFLVVFRRHIGLPHTAAGPCFSFELDRDVSGGVDSGTSPRAWVWGGVESCVPELS